MIQENKVWKKKISLKVQTILYRSNVQIGIIAALFTIIGAFVLPVRNANEYRVELNEIWNEPDLIAPFDFPIYKSPDSLQKEKKQLIKQLPEVFLENSNQMNQAISGADSFFNQLQHVLKLWQTWQAQKKMNVYRIRSEDTSLYYQKFKQAIHSLRPEVENRLLQYYTQNPIALSTTYTIGRQLIEQIYNVGYINKSISDIHSEVISLRTEGQYERLLAKSRVFDREKVNSAVQTSSQALAPLCQNLLLRFFQYYVQPNYLYNDSIYQLEKQYALNAISPYVSLVRKGELIVAKGAKITKDVANKISSLNKEQQQVPYSQEFWGIHLIGKILLLSLLTAIILLYLSLNRRELFLRWKKIVLLFSIFLVMILLSAVADFFSNTFASLYNVNIFYFIPLCMVPIFITTFFDDRIGFLGNIMIALLVALANHYNFEFF
ncbi:MAG: hypothetical protein RML72_07485, partial [Bacteroidia bacterium]|nr:hypothetical protein [Bacteroidia bacterium]